MVLRKSKQRNMIVLSCSVLLRALIAMTTSCVLDVLFKMLETAHVMAAQSPATLSC